MYSLDLSPSEEVIDFFPQEPGKLSSYVKLEPQDEVAYEVSPNTSGLSFSD